MVFLAPLVLVALAALAIPVLIHLIQREKKRVVPFPSLMFLQRVPYQSVRRRRIHNWALLLIRLAALALVVAAFARPFFPGAEPPLAPGGAREIVILLDRSYSMGYGNRWVRARDAARDAINGLESGDRGSLVLFSSGVEVAVRSTSERSQLLSALDSASLSAGSTRYAPALNVAGSILAESNAPRRHAILVSDFQRSGWRGDQATKFPPGVILATVAIADEANAPNLTVAHASLARSTFSDQERVTVTAGLLNRTNRPFSDAALTLEIGGQAIETKRVTLESQGTASVTFAPFTVSASHMRGTVRLAPDALERDNAFHFVVSPLEAIRVVVVAGGGASDETSLHLLRALSIGDQPRFDPVVRTPAAVSDEDLERARVVVLNDIAVSPALAARLARFAERGGGLFAVFGPRGTWPLTADLLPVIVSASVDRTRGAAARIGGLEYAHPIFEPFRAPRSGDFSTVRFHGYRAATPEESSQVLARFDAGAPALVERTFGTGRVLVWMSTLDLRWNDLALKPVFLPFVHSALRHLAGYAEPTPWLTVGQVVDLSTYGARDSAQNPEIALTPSGAQLPLDGEDLPVLELTEQGFYEIRSRTPGAPAAVVATNVDISESDLTPLDPMEIVAAVTARGAAEGGEGSAIPLTPEAQERSQRIWWHLLFAAILMLAIDTVLSNRLSKA